MSAIARNLFRVRNVANFIKSLANDANTLYLGIGRPQFWDVAGFNDNAIPLPADNIKSEAQDWSDLMSIKKVGIGNVSHGVVKRLWTANSIYDIYRHDWDGSKESVNENIFPVDLSESNFYVVTANSDVYVCISNNRDPVSGLVPPSTQSPDQGSNIADGIVSFAPTSGMVKTADGYIWKKVASASQADAIAFQTTDYTPVKTLDQDPGSQSFYQAQWVSQVNSKTHGGGVYRINILNQGSGYTHTGTKQILNSKAGTEAANGTGTQILSVRGDGTGLEYIVKFSSGKVSDVIVTNPGSGYTFATVAVHGANTTPASFEVIFTPMRGLGADPVKDLLAYNLIVNARLEYDENDRGSDLNQREFTVTNEYRKVCLISNPKLASGGALVTSLRLDCMYNLQMSAMSGVNPDDIITQTSPAVKGRVVDTNGTNLIRVIKTESEGVTAGDADADFVNGGNITTSSGGTGTISTVLVPEIDFGSGDIIYVDYRRAVARDISQIEDIKIVCEF